MTSRRTTFVLTVTALTAAALALVLSIHPPAPAFEPREEGIAGDDDPGAYGEWEHLRLRDPATDRIPEGIRARELEFASHLPRTSSLNLLKSAGIQDITWNHRGPYNVGGRTRALGVDVSGEDTVLAGGATGGMWRSSDGGESWTRTTSLTQLPAVSSLAQDTRPGKTAIWYYGTGELIGSSGSDGGSYYQGDGIFKSTDNGRSWKQLASTAANRPQSFDRPSDFVWSVAVDPNNTTQDVVYAAYYGVIVRSSDGGSTWKEVLRGTTVSGSYAGAYTDVAVAKNGTVYGAIGGTAPQKGLWRSTEGTSGSWKNITPAGWPTTVNRIVIGIAPSNPNVVYFLAETPGAGFLGRNFRGDSSWQSLWKYTYISGDGTGSGGVWEDRSANLPAFGGGSGDFFSQTGYDLHVHVKPDDENVLFIGGTNLYRSTDAFATATHSSWIGGYKNFDRDTVVINDYSYPDHHPDQHALVFLPSDPRVVYTGSDGGIHKTLDVMAPEVAWQSMDNGYLTSQFYSIAIDHATSGDYTIIGGLQDNGTWMSGNPNGAIPWTLRGTSDGAYTAIANGRNAYYISSQFGYIFRVALDAGGNMVSSVRVDPEGGTGYLFTNPFLLDPANQEMMFLVMGTSIWRNSNLAGIPPSPDRSTSVNWQRLANTRINDTTKISAIGITAVSPLHRIYYGTQNGRVFRLDGADEGDPTPVEITGKSFPQNAYVANVAVDPANSDNAVVVFSNYNVQSLFITTDAGETWTSIGGNLEPNATTGVGAGPSCRWFSFLHRGNTTLYMVGTSTGLYSTIKLNGTSTVWTQDATIGNTIVDMIDVRQSDGFVAVATHGSGVYTTTIEMLGVKEDRIVAQAPRMLEGNLPNPVRSRTSIHFTLPAAMPPSPVRLVLYDAAGRSVATLLDRTLGPGPHQVDLDLGSLSATAIRSGSYYYRLETPLGMESGKMNVIR